MNNLIPTGRIINRIYLIRGKKVMLDKDLAFLYQVDTRDMNKAVSRNIERFPADFMFQLSKGEFAGLMFQIGTSKKGRGGTRKLPYVFTELGVAMLSSVLRSKKAILVNIQIMRTFTKIRQMLASNQSLRLKIEDMERRYDKNFKAIFDMLKKMIVEEEKPKKIMGFVPRK
jgi:hypothetical protein